MRAARLRVFQEGTGRPSAAVSRALGSRDRIGRDLGDFRWLRRRLPVRVFLPIQRSDYVGDNLATTGYSVLSLLFKPILVGRCCPGEHWVSTNTPISTSGELLRVLTKV